METSSLETLFARINSRKLETIIKNDVHGNNKINSKIIKYRGEDNHHRHNNNIILLCL